MTPAAAPRLTPRSVAAVAYHRAADACAAALVSVPALEGPGMAAIRSMWTTCGVGRFCRSVGYRFVDRLRERGSAQRSVLACDIPLRVDVSDWVFSGLFLANVQYEAATSAYLKRHLRPGDVFVDVGANSGYFSLLAAHLVGPSGRVTAFEPNPIVRRLLRDNVHLNGYDDRVRLSECAISDRSFEDVRFFVTPHSGFSTLMPDASHGGAFLEGGHDIRVATRTLDDWMDETGTARIDILKVDVEGGELEAISGAARALAAGRIRRVICETSPGSPAHQCLESHGYTPSLLEQVGPVANVAYERSHASADA
jgi:FkbM family methyltransferase